MLDTAPKPTSPRRPLFSARSLVLRSLSLGISLLASACGGSTISLDCPSLCARAQQSRSTLDVDQCKLDCSTTTKALSQSAVASLSGCLQRTSDQTSTCESAAIATCSTGSEDISQWIDRFCQVQVQCMQGQLTMEDCKTGMDGEAGGFIKCINPSAREQIVTCAQATCPVEDCAIRYAPLFEELALGFS
jgi:hypothetical protein